MCYDAHRDTDREQEQDSDDIEVKDLTDDERDELIRLMQKSGLIMVKRKRTDEIRSRSS